MKDIHTHPKASGLDVDSLELPEALEKLKTTMALLSEKERELDLAAQIGQHLLQANTDLKSAYDDLVKHKTPRQASAVDIFYSSLAANIDPLLDSEASEKCPQPASPPAPVQWPLHRTSFPLRSPKASPNISRCASPRSVSPSLRASCPTLSSAMHDTGPVGSTAHYSRAAALPAEIIAPSRRRIDRENDYITAIEKNNRDLQIQLADTSTALDASRARHEREVARLGAEVTSLRAELAAANELIDKIERDRARLAREKHISLRESSTVEKADMGVIRGLSARLKVLEDSEERAVSARSVAEKRLDDGLVREAALRERCEELRARVGALEGVEASCRRLELHVAELQDALETQRATSGAEFGGLGIEEEDGPSPSRAWVPATTAPETLQLGAQIFDRVSGKRRGSISSLVWMQGGATQSDAAAPLGMRSLHSELQDLLAPPSPPPTTGTSHSLPTTTRSTPSESPKSHPRSRAPSLTPTQSLLLSRPQPTVAVGLAVAAVDTDGDSSEDEVFFTPSRSLGRTMRRALSAAALDEGRTSPTIGRRAGARQRVGPRHSASPGRLEKGDKGDGPLGVASHDAPENTGDCVMEDFGGEDSAEREMLAFGTDGDPRVMCRAVGVRRMVGGIFLLHVLFERWINLLRLFENGGIGTAHDVVETQHGSIKVLLLSGTIDHETVTPAD
ncbi:hypothetical protein BDK51DRAFT_42312 [Blyttiomyces helicus]|uniref:Uncharacterized protein n=1 Tax=Blyttiomyces helicus TaxID=388810 RepID=A0A4P9WJQ9_9FUNG|nr:hypothetical protein BDK51DRAFT_42312 [Blyttiomyces helicus]|eukprot:RKO91768.1 hypothetical protein BDK51DRAFT_42312 [Blyttiomyces helicus]